MGDMPAGYEEEVVSSFTSVPLLTVMILLSWIDTLNVSCQKTKTPMFSYNENVAFKRFLF